MKKGFTLIELLVVIAVVGVLAVGLFAFINPLQKFKYARDGVRKGDIGNISKALGIYFADVDKYPNTLEDLAAYESNVIPKDPNYPTFQYVYAADNSQYPPKFTICAYLETEDKALCSFSNQSSPATLALNDPLIPAYTVTAPSPTPTSVPVENWISCAGENEFCSFSGTRQVRYGANGSYAYGTFTDGVSCSNSIFGDPAWGFSKRCFFDVGSSVTLSSINEVVPIIYLASDSNVGDENVYKAQVNSSFETVRTWYSGQLGGKTFTLAPAVLFRSSITDAQLHSQYGTGIGIWIHGVTETTVANGMHPCDPKRDYYFVTPMDNIAGGMIGSENLGCSFVLPGTQSIQSHMGRMLGGVMDPGWPEWWADETREAQGGVAHEFGHGFGGECTSGNVYPGGGCNGLPHSTGPSIMFAWWDFGTTGVFFDDEKTKILNSPFIQ